MAAQAWQDHDSFKLRRGQGSILLNSHVFKMALATSASNVSNTSTSNYAAVTGELPTANGYTLGGVTLGGVTWSAAGATMTWTAASAQWTAAGGPITARYAFIYDDTDANKTVIAHTLLDTTPADVTAPDGVPLVISNATSIFTET